MKTLINVMKKVILYTSSGEFVAIGKVPEFNEPPIFLIWGDRTFEYQGTDAEGVDSYRECFAVTLVEIID